VKTVTLKADLTDPVEIDKLYQTELGIPTTIYCLHGIMSRGSEDNFDLGIKVSFNCLDYYGMCSNGSKQVNIDSIRHMLQAARQYGPKLGKPIKFVFTSSLAVYGGPLVSHLSLERLSTSY